MNGWAGSLAFAQEVAADVSAEQPVAQKKTRWVIPPIRVSGTLMEILRLDDGSNTKRTTSATTSLQLMAASYIWRPWFTQVDGTGAINYSRTVTKEAPSSNSNYLSGDINFHVFPLSRFPFNAFAGVFDSRTQVALTQVASRSKRFGFDQSYVSRNGRQNYRGGFKRNISQSAMGKEFADNLNGSANFILSRTQSAHINGYIDRFMQSLVRTQQRTLVATHQFSEPDELMVNVQSLANLGSNRTTSGGAFSQADYVQLSSYGSWLPDTEKPLRLNGSVRANQFKTEAGQGPALTRSRTQALGASAAFSYEPSERTIVNGNFAANRMQSTGGNAYTSSEALSMTKLLRSDLSASGSITAAQSSSPTSQQQTSTQTATLAYSPEGKLIKGFRHNWNASGSLSNSVSNKVPPKQTASIQAQQRLSRTFSLSPASLLSVNFSQQGRAATRSQSINHNAQMTWARQWRATKTSTTASASDFRSYGNNLAGTQLLNVQGTAESSLSRTSTLNGSVTYQVTRQLYSRVDRGVDVYAGGSMAYAQYKFMGVRNMIFTSNLKLGWSRSGAVNFTQPGTVAAGTATSPEEKSLIWENEIKYDVGKLETSLQMRASKINNDFTQTWLLSLARHF